MLDSVPRRLDKLRASFAANGFDAILVSHLENRRYLSGFTGSSGYLLVSAKRALLATDFRYFEQAKREAPHFELMALKSYEAGWLAEATSEVGAKGVAFEAAHLPFASYRQFVDSISCGSCGIQLVPEEGMVESLRAVKEPDELVLIAAAAALTHTALGHLSTVGCPGMTEKELAWRLERFLRESGSGPLPFDIIVASGPNAALPHVRPSERVIGAGEPVVIDVGVRISGYCSDVTRTICLGKPDSTFTRVYDVVLGAQLAALATIGSGLSGGDVDRLARTVIEQAGYGELFGHGLGHGLGLEPHEFPRLGPSSTDVITDGMVFTVEPGVYLPGWGGVRIEDTVVLESGRARVLK